VRKLGPNWEGLYIVVAKGGNVLYAWLIKTGRRSGSNVTLFI